jgi:hypothetical protein
VRAASTRHVVAAVLAFLLGVLLVVHVNREIPRLMYAQPQAPWRSVAEVYLKGASATALLFWALRELRWIERATRPGCTCRARGERPRCRACEVIDGA